MAVWNPCLSVLKSVLLNAFIGLVIPTALMASMKVVTLQELVEQSAVIALGHQRTPPVVASQVSEAIVSFEPTMVLKGQELIRQGDIALCNPNNSSEWPDLAKETGNYVVFVSKQGGCFSLVWGYRSLVRMTDGQARTSAIQGQPKEQPVAQFLARIREALAGAGLKDK
jgi:hypothetical protein